MRQYLWDYPVDALSTTEAAERLIARSNRGLRSRVVTLNPEMVMVAETNPQLKEAILRADLVIPDGTGIIWALRRKGLLVKRLTGIDLAEALMAILNRQGGSIYLLGGQPGLAEMAGLRISRQLPGLRVVGCRHGYFSMADGTAVGEAIRHAEPDLLLVGMGTPRQDIWLAEHWDELGTSIGIGIGGGIDLWAGKVKRAPKTCRELGLEWFYRGLVQPGRWRRLSKLPAFVWRVCRTSLEKQL